jgi:hypothetical protein
MHASPCVKVTKANKVIHIQKFKCPVIRTSWLRQEGFYETSGVWKHLDGRVIGLFSDQDPQNIIDNCHKSMKKHTKRMSIYHV